MPLMIFFCEVAPDLDRKLPITDVDPLSYLRRAEIETGQFTPVTPSECIEIITNLKNSKQDIDSVSVNIFKKYMDKFTVVLCDIINQSFQTGIFPDFFKIGKNHSNF